MAVSLLGLPATRIGRALAVPIAMLDSATNSLVRLLLEPACVSCRAVLERPLASPICERCWLGISGVEPPWCARCGDELPAWQSSDAECARCLSHPPHFSIARSAGRYDGSLREVVHAFKYRHRRLLAEPLGRMMRLAGADVLDGADAVVPVPLHPFRSFRRGFNQADDLARQLGLPVWRALRRQPAWPAAGQSACVGPPGQSDVRLRHQRRLDAPRAPGRFSPARSRRRRGGRCDDDGRDD